MSWKKLLLVQTLICFLSIILLGKARAESKLWEYVKFNLSSAQDHAFQYLTFVDENTIVGAIQNFNIETLTDEGWDIYLSTDGGQTWSKKVETVAPIQKIRFLNRQLGFALGYDALFDTIYLGKTMDGGNTWTDLSKNFKENLNPDEGVSLRDVWIIDSDRVYVGTNYRVYVSTDGGASWSQAGDISAINPDIVIYSYPHESNLHFATSSVGFVSSYKYLFRTQDGGSSWERLDAPWSYTEEKEILGLKFLDANNGWALVVDYRVSSSSPGYGSWLYRTADGGNSWSLVYKWDGELGPYPREKMYVKNSADIWLGGLNKIWHSSDGGATWALEIEGTGIVWGFEIVGSESVPRAIVGTADRRNQIEGYYKHVGTIASLPDICCNMAGGVSVNSGSYSSEVTVGQTDTVDIKAAISSSVTATGDIYVVLYWEGLYYFKIGDPDQWWEWDGVSLKPYQEGVSLSGYSLDIYSGPLSGLTGDLLFFVAYWGQEEAEPAISNPVVIHMQ